MDNGASSYRRFLSGDDDALTQIVGDYKDGLILYLNAYVNNIHIAEDLAEDTFFRLIIKKPKFAEKSTFKTWLYSIGRNIAVDHIRRNRKNTSISFDDIERCLADEQDLEQSYLKEERKIFLHKAMSKLNQSYKAILWLVYFEGFTNREASVILNKTDRQFTNLLYRAKQSLKITLQKEGFVYEEL